MYQSLLQSVQTFGTFSEVELKMLSSKLTARTIKAGDFLLKAGETCQSLGFVESGSFRHYYVDEDKEVTVALQTECEWILDHQSFISQKPSVHNICAFEKSQILNLSLHALHELIGSSPSFFRLGKLLENSVGGPVFLNMQPEEKYLQLLRERPKIIQTFPLKYIASLLGITPETLSRIRNRINTSGIS